MINKTGIIFCLTALTFISSAMAYTRDYGDGDIMEIQFDWWHSFFYELLRWAFLWIIPLILLLIYVWIKKKLK